MPTAALERPTDDIAEYIKRIVDTAPPLTEERKSRIVALFRAGS